MSSEAPPAIAAPARSISEVEVTVDPSSPSLLFCACCGGRAHSREGEGENGEGNVNKLRPCSQCHSVLYCGAECQRKDWQEGGHKTRCGRIVTATEGLRARAEALHDMPDGFGGDGDDDDDDEEERINYFEEESGLIGDFWGLVETRDYCRQRRALLEELLDEALGRASLSGGRCYEGRGGQQMQQKEPKPVVNRLALELALEHSLDLLFLDWSDNQGNRHIVPSLLIGLERYQDAYDFIKYWLVSSNHDEGDPDENRDFLHLTGEDALEPLQVLSLTEYSEPSMVLHVALIKFHFYQVIRGIQTLHSGVVHNPDISSIIVGMIGIPREWLGLNASHILSETKQLLKYVHKANKFVLPGLIHPGSLLQVVPAHSSCSRKEEAALIIQRSVLWWKDTKFVKQFLQNFVANLEDK